MHGDGKATRSTRGRLGCCSSGGTEAGSSPTVEGQKAHQSHLREETRDNRGNTLLGVERDAEVVDSLPQALQQQVQKPEEVTMATPKTAFLGDANTIQKGKRC